MKAVHIILSFYQRYISPCLGRHCRYEPSCSEYFRDAVERRGLARGLALGILRLARCHPFTVGGWDPVPDARGRGKQ